MKQQKVVREIEQRAKASRISIAELCRRAGISPDTFFKWRKTERNPNPPGANLHSIEALYRELAKIEAEDAKRLRKGGKVAA
ncbi:transposase [Porphyrobacter sp. YT40]|uniref:transposase n=1 Tax=Porphyrobacter sp. YT40 TaxID=2547601 RepID=UPI00114189F4|nr:transposase [Porphyrobacter sp. YT40]QDH35815.1 transposase [Porphyrobacter sp. YT40]